MSKYWGYRKQLNIKDHFLEKFLGVLMDQGVDPWLLPRWNEVTCARIILYKESDEESPVVKVPIILKVGFDIADIQAFLHQLDFVIIPGDQPYGRLPITGTVWMNDRDWLQVQAWEVQCVEFDDWVWNRQPEIPKECL